ncbi:hypothetical protein GXW82_32975 [Streptacidiphilus sp. 4-A2]|nr:hypothetical protein [Streptacidiphilus sp. 4-A2]
MCEVTVMLEATVGSALKPGPEPVVPDPDRGGRRVLDGCPVAEGFVQYTLDEDGQPLDAVVLMDEPALPGREVRARPVAVLYALCDGQPTEVVVCVDTADPRFVGMAGLEDLRAWHADQRSLAQLLGRLGPDRDWAPLRWEGPDAAEEFVFRAQRSYQRMTGCPE